MLEQVDLKQLEQEWIVAPEADLVQEWQNNGCCAESLQPRPNQQIDNLSPVPDPPEDWWPGQCIV